MENNEVTLEDEVLLALSNAKRLARDANVVVKDLARVRDTVIDKNVQSRKDITTNGTDR